MSEAIEFQIDRDRDGLHEVVIVGGGAAGLHLATRLAKRDRKQKRLRVTLVDESLTHIWKPSLHEYAVGVKGVSDDEISFLSHSVSNGYEFRLGRFAGLDAEKKEVLLDAVNDSDGDPLAPKRRIAYDTLVLAIGSVSKDFGIEGVAEHCLFLDTPSQAKIAQRKLFNLCLSYETGAIENSNSSIEIVVVGGGATGVELAAELREATRRFSRNGIDRLESPDRFRIRLIEAGDRLVASLPEKVSTTVKSELERLGIAVECNARVRAIDQTSISLESEKTYPAHLVVWAAGIQASPALNALPGVQHDRIGRVKVNPMLEIPELRGVFVIGDAAHCEWRPGIPVPPRAQAASQQAIYLAEQLRRRIAAKPLKPFTYNDQGSLISLSKQKAVGALMGRSIGTVTIEGRLARLAYWALYRAHLSAVLGPLRMSLLTISQFFADRIRPRLKLH